MEPLPSQTQLDSRCSGLRRRWALSPCSARYAAYYLTQPRDRIFTTPVGGHETITFADGSKIELNTDTVLRARMTTAQRTVWLEKGEAYFQVKHDAAHPFVVMAGDHRVTDLGTKFLVRRDPGRLEVALLRGPRAVRRGGREAAIAIHAAHARRCGNGHVEHDVRDERNAARSSPKNLSWRHGVLVFDNTPLADAASEFNRYNQTQARHRRSGRGRHHHRRHISANDVSVSPMPHRRFSVCVSKSMAMKS